jgi:hypothetical protein
LLPHSPYILDEDCRIKDSSKWFTTEIAWQRQAVYPAYWQQSICANKLVMEMIDNAGSRSGAKLPIVIVHGDHGSRISYYDPATRDSPDPRDMLTTFAVVMDRARKNFQPVNLPMNGRPDRRLDCPDAKMNRDAASPICCSQLSRLALKLTVWVMRVFVADGIVIGVACKRY